ncbi:hypothetical protein V6N12_076093 [Hibiscus sabdariffa]|uniref:Uncharacterized protein n=1 Tax=Hibiscus sabdariffa TaxID=183260 RepID=A0ABR2AZN4_9ROSI
MRGERSSPLGHAPCRTKRRASEGRNGISSRMDDLQLKVSSSDRYLVRRNGDLGLDPVVRRIRDLTMFACEFEEDKVDSMEVQQALPPVPEASEPLPLAQEPVSPSFEIQAAEVNQEDIWREFEQQEQPAPTGGAKLTRPHICESSPHWKIR